MNGASHSLNVFSLFTLYIFHIHFNEPHSNFEVIPTPFNDVSNAATSMHCHYYTMS